MRGTNPTFVLTVASVKMWFRDRQAIFWTFFLPLVLMVIFGVLNFGDLGAVDLGLVDEAHNQASRDLSADLYKIESFDLFEDGTKDQEIEALSDGDRDLVLVIPPNFAGSGGPATVQMFFNAGQVREAQVGQAILRQILDEMTFALNDVPSRFTIDAQPVDSRKSQIHRLPDARNCRNVHYADGAIQCGLLLHPTEEPGGFAPGFWPLR